MPAASAVVAVRAGTVAIRAVTVRAVAVGTVAVRAEGRTIQ